MRWTGGELTSVGHELKSSISYQTHIGFASVSHRVTSRRINVQLALDMHNVSHLTLDRSGGFSGHMACFLRPLKKCWSLSSSLSSSDLVGRIRSSHPEMLKNSIESGSCCQGMSMGICGCSWISRYPGKSMDTHR